MGSNAKNINNVTNLRKSKNRDMVIDVLKKSELPISIDEIYSQLKSTNKTLALSTVYRIVEKLLQMEVISSSMKDGNRALYELTKDSHHHYLICTNCKKIVPLDICPIHNLEHKISKDTGFSITGHKFELYGKCPDCI